MRGSWFAVAVLVGCADTETPTWALDPIWVEPAVDGDVYGFQTWELYAERLMTYARTYGFWRFMTERERADSWRYLELFYALQLRPLAAGMAP